MQKIVLFALALSLCACETAPQVARETPRPEAFPAPPPPLHAKHQAAKARGATRALASVRPSAQPVAVSSAGPVTAGGVGVYMDAQEKDLRARLNQFAVRRVGDALVVVMPAGSLFGRGGLSGHGSGTLSRLAGLLRRYDHSSLEIGGYVDAAVPDAEEISAECARVVADALVADGVSAHRITYQGFGAGHVWNAGLRDEPSDNRVELRIVARPET